MRVNLAAKGTLLERIGALFTGTKFIYLNFGAVCFNIGATYLAPGICILAKFSPNF